MFKQCCCSSAESELPPLAIADCMKTHESQTANIQKKIQKQCTLNQWRDQTTRRNHLGTGIYMV